MQLRELLVAHGLRGKNESILSFGPMIFPAAMDLIGNTPVVDITCLSPNPQARLLVKLEGQNPFGSFKDRVARAMLEEARRDGRLSPGQMVLAPSSGNTGISLAGLGGMIGHPVTVVMPASASRERRQTLEFLGADLEHFWKFHGRFLKSQHFASQCVN